MGHCSGAVAHCSGALAPCSGALAHCSGALAHCRGPLAKAGGPLAKEAPQMDPQNGSPKCNLATNGPPRAPFWTIFRQKKSPERGASFWRGPGAQFRQTRAENESPKMDTQNESPN